MNKLYVGNLPYSVDDAKLDSLFSQYGTVKEAVVIKDRFTDRSKGFGFVEFTDAEGAKAALALDGQETDGRALKVSEARASEGSRGGRGGRGGDRGGFGGRGGNGGNGGGRRSNW